MTFELWLSLLAICILGAMSPGPSLAMVVKHTLGSSRTHGVATAWAHSIGVGFYALMTLLGLAVILQKFPKLFMLITVLGAGYLAWLGFNALRSKGGVAAKLKAGEDSSLQDAMRDGLMISLLNPKMALFFIALFSQFVAVGSELSSRITIVATPLLVDGLWYTFIAFVLSNDKVVKKLRTQAVWIDRASGIVLLLLASRVFWQVFQ
ncbi:MAG: LysE family translocator [Aliivibrio sp.]|uniref:LysE family translocator n=1 Tax=Aliivibrio sp. TaxID=1872443 RepID=UPI001A48FA2C|nr:LysE family translocator [Aliivibrio sp.]